MNRRKFLKSLMVGTAGIAAAPLMVDALAAPEGLEWIEKWLTEEVWRRYLEAEEKLLLYGDGMNEPRGFL